MLAEVESETVSDRLGDVAADALVVALAYAVAEVKIQTLEKRLISVGGETLVLTLPIKLEKVKAETLGCTLQDAETATLFDKLCDKVAEL